MTIPSEALRKCKQCEHEKSLSDFYLRSDGKSRHWTCKRCIIANQAAKRRGPDRAKILDAENRSMRAYRAETKIKVFAAYGGFKCVCCGETEPSFLTLDHINNDGGEFRKKELGTRNAAGYHTYRWLLRNGCPPTVQVMCMNCQHGKLMNNGVCPHQRTCNDYPSREYAQAGGSASPLQKAG